MLVNKLTIEQMVTSKEAMAAVAGLAINPAIYKNKSLAQIVIDFNQVLIFAKIPYEIEPPEGRVYYLRFEAERLDRALYILSCLVEPEKIKN